MGSNIAGFKNEDNLICVLNNKKLNELNENLQNFIKYLYKDIKDNEIIYAENGKHGQKPDMEIYLNRRVKRISIKIGSGNSVHQENIDFLIQFLEEIGISESCIKKLLKFHWGDGTIDGSGENRISSSEYKKNNKNEINLINQEINQKNNLAEAVNRFLFIGKSKSYDSVDCIYYGDIKNGHWANKDEIMNYILSNSFKSDSVHFGPLNYQVWNRCLNFNPKTENRRNVIQIKWASLLQDILIIEEIRGKNND